VHALPLIYWKNLQKSRHLHNHKVNFVIVRVAQFLERFFFVKLMRSAMVRRGV